MTEAILLVLLLARIGLIAYGCWHIFVAEMFRREMRVTYRALKYARAAAAFALSAALWGAGYDLVKVS